MYRYNYGISSSWLVRNLYLIAALGLLSATPRSFAAQTVNWSGAFAPCSRRSELLKQGPMTLGVRFSTTNRSVEREFKRAMDFWSSIIDMEWYEDDTSNCSINVVDGTPEILANSVIARSQFPEWDHFEGWIAFDSHAPLSTFELYVTAVHEIGHMLGLKHNPSASSVMYFLDLEGPEVVDSTDLLGLATRHRLRIAVDHAPIPVIKHFSLARAKSENAADDRQLKVSASPTALTKHQ